MAQEIEFGRSAHQYSLRIDHGNDYKTSLNNHAESKAAILVKYYQSYGGDLATGFIPQDNPRTVFHGQPPQDYYVNEPRPANSAPYTRISILAELPLDPKNISIAIVEPKIRVLVMECFNGHSLDNQQIVRGSLYEYEHTENLGLQLKSQRVQTYPQNIPQGLSERIWTQWPLPSNAEIEKRVVEFMDKSYARDIIPNAKLLIAEEAVLVKEGHITYGPATDPNLSALWNAYPQITFSNALNRAAGDSKAATVGII